MDALRNLVVLALLALVFGIAQAQEDLSLFTPVTGTLDSGDTDTWTFQAADGAMLSIHVRATSGDLDPVLTIRDNSNNVLFSNDDFDYPDSADALLEGLTIPGTGAYRATVSGFGETSGEYELIMLPGFADLAHQESFEDTASWQSSDETEVIIGNNRLALIVSGAQQRTIVTDEDGDTWDDFYVHVDVPELTGAQGWQVGLTVRQQDEQNYYLYSLNDRGQWRFLVVTDEGERVIRDWSEHPAIIPGSITFSLGLLVNETGFDFFYNGQLVGRLTDDTLTDAGEVGLVAETPSALGSEVTAQFRNLTLTTPLATDYHPQQLLTGNSSVMIQELQRRQLIPPSGQMDLVVPESFVTFNRPGVNVLPLGGSETYGNFALGTTLTWEIGDPNLPGGCGLTMRTTEPNDYLLAYLDQTGTYGLSQRSGDDFEPGIFGEGLALAPDRQRLLVIANGAELLYYINGQLVGTLDSAEVAGTIGNAVVNFEANITSCQFTDTWIWTWE